MAFEIDLRDLPDHGRYTISAPFVWADAAGRRAYHSNLKCAPRDDHLVFGSAAQASAAGKAPCGRCVD